MNPTRILVAEFMVALTFTSWFAIKNKYWPWPPTVVRLAVSFAIFALVAQAAPEFAAAIAGGAMLAGFLKVYGDGLDTYRGGVPDYEPATFPYQPLNFGAQTGSKP